MKFRSNYCGVPHNFARTSRSAVKYRCRSNNRTREKSLKNRSKRNFAYYRLLSSNICKIRRITFALLLHNTVVQNMALFAIIQILCLTTNQLLVKYRSLIFQITHDIQYLQKVPNQENPVILGCQWLRVA